METIREEESIAESTETTVVEPLTALYVGDLDDSVTLEQLQHLFNQIGDVDSVKICVDQTTQRPLGYGYVNYTNPQHGIYILFLVLSSIVAV